MPRPYNKTENVAELIKTVNSRQELADKLGVKYAQAAKLARRFGLAKMKKRGPQNGKNTKLKPFEKEIIDGIRAGKSNKTLAEEYGCERTAIADVAKRWGVPASRERAVSAIPEDKLRALLEARYSVQALCRHFSCGDKLINAAMRRYGLTPTKPFCRAAMQEGLANGESYEEVAATLGCSPTHVNNVALKEGFAKKNDKRSSCETSMVNFLKSQCGDLAYITNGRKALKGKEIDFFIPDLGLGFELDGNFWHSEGKHTNKYNIRDKVKAAKDLGLRTIHILDSEWFHKRECVEGLIKAALGKFDETVGARKTQVCVLTLDEERSFLEKNHIQGYVPSKLAVGLKLGSRLVGLMSFGSPRYNRSSEYELIRLAFAAGVMISGGAEKMFNEAKRILSFTSVISYCDRRLFSGKVYTRLGFEASHVTSPNYKYFKGYGTPHPLNRQGFQKKSLKHKLETFDPNLTEYENMQLNGFRRVWDAGNEVFIWQERSH